MVCTEQVSGAVVPVSMATGPAQRNSTDLPHTLIVHPPGDWQGPGVQGVLFLGSASR